MDCSDVVEIQYQNLTIMISPPNSFEEFVEEIQMAFDVEKSLIKICAKTKSCSNLIIYS